MPATPRRRRRLAQAYAAGRAEDARRGRSRSTDAAHRAAGEVRRPGRSSRRPALEPGRGRAAVLRRGIGLVSRRPRPAAPSAPSSWSRCTAVRAALGLTAGAAELRLVAAVGGRPAGRGWLVGSAGEPPAGACGARLPGRLAGGCGAPGRLPLLARLVPLPAVLDDRLLRPAPGRAAVCLVPLLLVLVGRAVPGHARPGAGATEGAARSRGPARCRGRRATGRARRRSPRRAAGRG